MGGVAFAASPVLFYRVCPAEVLRFTENSTVVFVNNEKAAAFAEFQVGYAIKNFKLTRGGLSGPG